MAIVGTTLPSDGAREPRARVRSKKGRDGIRRLAPGVVRDASLNALHGFHGSALGGTRYDAASLLAIDARMREVGFERSERWCALVAAAADAGDRLW